MKKMRNIYIGVVVILFLGIGAFVFFQNNPAKNDSTSSSISTNTENTSSSEAKDAVTITYTSSGFSPNTVIVKSGGLITWMNNSDEQVQVGVDPHPSHTGNKEITGNEFTLDLDKGQQKTMTVNKTGTFGYHNHINADETGTIIVK